MKKNICFLLSLAMVTSLGMTTYASTVPSKADYQFDFYGTDDKKGSFEVNIANVQQVRQARTGSQDVVLSVSPDEVSGNTVSYVFDLPAGGTVSFALDGYGEKDNSFVIFDKGGRLIGYTDILTATDTRGNEIKSNISVANNTIHQTFASNVNMNDITIDFEIHALQTTSTRATTSFNDHWSKSEWIDRSNEVSLSLYAIYAFPTNSSLYVAWDTIIAKHGNDSNWSNESGMKKQLRCHNDFSPAKRPWNLEPGRPDVSYATTVLNGCNP